MMLLISQIVGCLVVAAGIGGVVGWLLRHLPVRQLTGQFRDVTAMLRLKGQALEKAQYELKVQAAAMQLLESKMTESEALEQSTRQELSITELHFKPMDPSLGRFQFFHACAEPISFCDDSF